MAHTNAPELFYSEFGADPDLSELVDMFVEEMPERIQVLQDHFAAKNLDQLARTAHQLKGASGSYGFHQLTPFAGRLEALAKEHAAETSIFDAVEELVLMCRRCRAGQPVDQAD